MNRLAWVFVLFLAASPAWGARKTSIQRLRDLLVSMRQAGKTDAEVAAALEQVELTEQLNRSTMKSLADCVPGPNSTEQFYVLEARSAVLAPPPADLPSTPPPDAAATKAILDKAVDYAARSYAQLPHLSATRNTFRFQDSGEYLQAGSDSRSSANDSDSNLVNASRIVHFIGSIESPVEIENGAEKIPSAKDKGKQSPVDQITLLGQSPVLSSILQEAQAAGKIEWLRWEMVNGSPAAVFSFAVDKKKSRYAVNYCCFPDIGQASDSMSYGNYGARAGVSSDPGSTQPSLGGTSIAMPTTMQVARAANWKTFKATVPYRGELFVDPATGIVLRLVTQADFRPSDLVQRENRRIDYGPVTVGGKTLILPVKSFIDTEVIPNGYTGFGKHPIRDTLFTIDYKDYQLAGAEQK
jgi:hypothetical protein